MPHQNGIPNEEDGRVVAHEVPVAILRIQLDCKAPWVSDRVSAARLSPCKCACAEQVSKGLSPGPALFTKHGPARSRKRLV